MKTNIFGEEIVEGETLEGEYRLQILKEQRKYLADLESGFFFDIGVAVQIFNDDDAMLSQRVRQLTATAEAEYRKTEKMTAIEFDKFIAGEAL